MDINNIAIVRATNVIPFDGIVRPISEVPYIKKNTSSTFAYEIKSLLKQQDVIKSITYVDEEEDKKIGKENEKILQQYIPYSSEYNSMVLWAINGLVPDDINNIFSNKDCAIIESLEEQIDNSEVISLNPTDTAIKGNVKLSPKAVIKIRKERYDKLTQ